jgi:single-strand DNA-binding protein
MSRSVNKIILVGNVGRDPEVRETKTGQKVVHLTLATNRRIPKGDDTGEERTDWHRLTLWNRLAQLAEDCVTRGDRVYVEGRLEYDEYERDGVTIPTAEVTVREIVLLSPRTAAVTEMETEVETETAAA